MRTKPLLFPASLAGPVVLLGCLVVCTTARADEDVYAPANDPVLPRDPALWTDPTSAPNLGPNRVRLFRMQPGFLSSPVGLDTDPDPVKDDDGGLDWLNVTMGNDNPFFDVRLPGDPGGVGFFKIHTQIQLFDSKTTGVALNVQAVTPAGRESDGVQDGQKVLSPSLSVFHTLDDGTAIQGFVGKHVPLAPTAASGSLQQGLQCGLAVQRPLWLEHAERPEGCYFFVGALGRYRNPDLGVQTTSWDMLPGLHWQVTPSTFMTGSMILPVSGTTPTRTDLNQWQLTLSWQF